METTTMAISLNLCLDIRAKKTGNREGTEFPIKITITKARSTAYLPTGIQVLPSQWKDRKVIGRKDKIQLNDFLDSQKTRIRHMINDGVERYREMTATEIKNDIARQLDGTDLEKHLFLPRFEKFAKSRKAIRTQEIYMVTAVKIKQLIPKSEKIKLDDIDLDWLENFRPYSGGTLGTKIQRLFSPVVPVLRHQHRRPHED